MRRPFSPRTSWVWVARMMISVRAWVTRTSQPEYPSEERVRVKNSESSALQTEELGQALPPVTNTRTRRLPELGERSENHGQSPPNQTRFPAKSALTSATNLRGDRVSVRNRAFAEAFESTHFLRLETLMED